MLKPRGEKCFILLEIFLCKKPFPGPNVMGALSLKAWIEGKVGESNDAFEEESARAVPSSFTHRELGWRWKVKNSEDFGSYICGFSGFFPCLQRGSLKSKGVGGQVNVRKWLVLNPNVSWGGTQSSQALLPCAGFHYLGNSSVNTKHVIANSPFFPCLC